jgi:hypothetical protein
MPRRQITQALFSGSSVPGQEQQADEQTLLNAIRKRLGQRCSFCTPGTVLSPRVLTLIQNARRATNRLVQTTVTKSGKYVSWSKSPDQSKSQYRSEATLNQPVSNHREDAVSSSPPSALRWIHQVRIPQIGKTMKANMPIISRRVTEFDPFRPSGTIAPPVTRK